VDYDTFLDNRWVYIYFGYKEKSESVGAVSGMLLYTDKLVLKTQFPGVLHKRVGNYIHYQVGSANTERNEYHNFNGQMTQVMFSLNRGAYVSDENVLRSLVFSKFQFRVRDGNPDGDVLISEEKIEVLREETETAPHEIEDHQYAGSYAVTLWYRYLRTAPVPWQTVFRFTTNEPEYLGD
jgi:protein transport protein SEC24